MTLRPAPTILASWATTLLFPFFAALIVGRPWWTGEVQLLGLLGVLTTARVRVVADERGLRAYGHLRRWRMSWDEVRRVEWGTTGTPLTQAVSFDRLLVVRDGARRRVPLTGTAGRRRAVVDSFVDEIRARAPHVEVEVPARAFDR